LSVQSPPGPGRRRHGRRVDNLARARKVNPLLAPTRGFAPTSYFFKIFVLVASTCALEAAMILRGHSMFGSIVLGVLYAWIGLNIQHDANHGSVSRDSRVNRALGLFQVRARWE
jgi:fatty acid desaturase (delta-4 desaturase)